MTVDASHYKKILAPVVADKLVILAIGSLTDSAAWVHHLRALGSKAPFLLAESLGAGELPRWPDVRARVVGGTGAEHQLGAFRHYRDALVSLPADLREQIDEYDAERDALVLVRAQHQSDDVAGRPVFAPRPEAWRRLEDKLIAHEIWAAAGVPHLAARNVGVSPADIRAAFRALDRGDGVVCAGDFREGYNSGADFVRWIRADDDVDACQAFLASHCDRVRVMPFMEGLPCGVHGIVFPEDVAVFCPVELVVLRMVGSCRFLYAGNGTFWRPGRADQDAIRDFARSVGIALRERAGYRGAFTLDGILTADGFRPTEINARTGAALWTVAGSLPDLPLSLLEMCVRRGVDLDYRPRALEELVMRAVDESPRGGGWSMTPVRLENRTSTLVHTADGFRFAMAGEAHDAVLETGASGVGGVVRIEFTGRMVATGESISQRVAECFGFLDRALGTTFGELRAPTVFQSGPPD